MTIFPYKCLLAFLCINLLIDAKEVSIITINRSNYHSMINLAKKPIIIDVYAPWCPPCKKMMPIFEQVALELEDSYTFAKLNIDESGSLIKQFKVSSLPTLLFFDNGQLLGKTTGLKSAKEIKDLVYSYYGKPETVLP